jgi:hypothetical protein
VAFTVFFLQGEIINQQQQQQQQLKSSIIIIINQQHTTKKSINHHNAMLLGFFRENRPSRFNKYQKVIYPEAIILT